MPPPHDLVQSVQLLHWPQTPSPGIAREDLNDFPGYYKGFNLNLINAKQTHGHMGQWRRLGLLGEGPDMAGHCQSAGGWNRTCTWTGDLLHTTLNTDPKESTQTTGHQLQSVFVCEGAERERYTVVRKMQFILTCCFPLLLLICQSPWLFTLAVNTANSSSLRSWVLEMI